MTLPKLTLVQKGTGIPVVLIHAFPLSSAMWKPQLEPLSSMCRVICPDLPGFGRTPRMKSPSISGMAIALKEALDELNIRKPVVIVGLSMGGYVALEFIKQFPRRVRALGLLSTRAGADSAEQKEKRRALALKVREQGQEILSKETLPRLIGKTALHDKPQIFPMLKNILIKNTTADGVADALLAMAKRNDLTRVLKKIQCPVLIVAGDEDEVIPLSEFYAMKKAITHATLQMIPCTGHLINLEQPRIVSDMIGSFVAGLPHNL